MDERNGGRKGDEMTMNSEDREKIAIWKFGLIAPALNGTHDHASNRAYFMSIEGVSVINPVTGLKRTYSRGTYENWLSLYRRFGIDGLTPGCRSDMGTFRTLSEDAQNFIRRQLEKYPRIPNTIIRKRLLEEGLVDDSLSQSTVNRFVKQHVMGLPKAGEYHEGKDRKAFEFEYANQMWQADTTYLGKIEGRQVYLIVIIDDASRMPVGYEAFMADNAVNFQKVLKDAVRTYGVPSILFVDNGSPYSNHQLQMICARLGTELIHTPTRDGAAKGKVERWFSTFKNSVFYCEDWDAYRCLDDVNARIREFISTDYNTRSHGTTETDEEGNLLNARERFLRDASRFRYKDDDEIDRLFLHSYKRKVRTDATVRLDNIFYEVPMEYIGETVTLVIDPFEKASAWMETDAGRVPVGILDRKANRSVRRRQHMKMGGD
ncbi:MAG: DDE-type integrase/transposase/recombinase [Candidatus Cryptobacteroides sp.]